MKSALICSVAMAATLVVGSSHVALALDKVPIISLDLARKMAAGCEAKAKEMNWKMNISVVDSGANEISFEKMDGAFLGSRDIAFHKAQTAAHFPFPTRFFQELAFGKDPTTLSGKADTAGWNERPTVCPRGTGRAPWGGGEVRSTAETG